MAKSASGWAVMDRGWEAIQKKTFTRWCNKYLKPVGLALEDMVEDFEDGVKIISLVEQLAEEPVKQRYNKKPKLRVQKVENVGIAMKFMVDHDVRLTAIGPEDIVDKNQKLILGMIWTIISKWQIEDISIEQKTAKEALLLWVQKNTKGYNGVAVTNFTTSFSDGLAFCALVNKFRPNVLDYSTCAASDPEGNFKKAFAAFEKLGICVLLDAEDMIGVKPDERSVVTQVSELYHFFMSEAKAEVAARRIQKVLELTRQNDAIKHDYVERTTALLAWIKDAMIYLNNTEFDNTLAGILDRQDAFKAWKHEQLPPKVLERLDLDGLFNSLQTKLRLSNRPEYVPPDGMHPQHVASLWEDVDAAVLKLGRAIGTELQRQYRLESMVQGFDSEADALTQWIADKIIYLNEADVGNSLAVVNGFINNHGGFEAECEGQATMLQKIKDDGQNIINLNYCKKDEITQKMAGMDADWEKLSNATVARGKALQAQLDTEKSVEELRKDLANKASVYSVYLDHALAAASEALFVRSADEQIQEQQRYDEFIAEKTSMAPKLEEVTALKAQMDAQNVTIPYSYCDVTVEQLAEKSVHLEEATLEYKKNLDDAIAQYAAECQAKEDAITQECEAMRQEYETRTIELNNWIDEALVYVSRKEFDNTLEGINRLIAEFETWDKQSKPPQATERLSLDNLYNNLQAKLRVNGRDAYMAPEGMSPQDLAAKWDHLLNEQTALSNAQQVEQQRQDKLKAMHETFNSRIAALTTWCEATIGFVKDAEIGETLEAVQGNLVSHGKLEGEVQSQEDTLNKIKNLADTIKSDNYVNSDDLTNSVVEMDAVWVQLKEGAQARRSALEAEQTQQQTWEARRVELAKNAQVVMMGLNNVLSNTLAIVFVNEDSDKEIQQAKYDKFVAANASEAAKLEELKGLKATMEGMNIPNPYAYSETTIEQIQEKVAEIGVAAGEYRTRLDASFEKYNEQTQKLANFNEGAMTFRKFCDDTKVEVTAVGKTISNLEGQKTATEQKIQPINAKQDDLTQLQQQYLELEDLNIAHLADVTIESMDALYHQLIEFVQKQVGVIDAQIIEKTGSQVSAEQLATFQYNFNHFDKDNSNGLNPLELKGLLQSIGEDVEDEFCATVMKDFGKVLDTNEITFEEFVSFITGFLEDADSLEQTLDSFKLCAGDKPYATEADLKQVFSEEDVKYLLETMPKAEMEGGYDYKAYSESLYAR